MDARQGHWCSLKGTAMEMEPLMNGSILLVALGSGSPYFLRTEQVWVRPGSGVGSGSSDRTLLLPVRALGMLQGSNQPALTQLIPFVFEFSWKPAHSSVRRCCEQWQRPLMMKDLLRTNPLLHALLIACGARERWELPVAHRGQALGFPSESSASLEAGTDCVLSTSVYQCVKPPACKWLRV